VGIGRGPDKVAALEMDNPYVAYVTSPYSTAYRDPAMGR
jgi:hypothetical protein